MKKHAETFSRFSLDMVVSGLKGPAFLGTDMEKAFFEAFKKVFPSLANLLCVKHLFDRDQQHLSKIGARNSKTFLADIYGLNDGITRAWSITC